MMRTDERRHAARLKMAEALAEYATAYEDVDNAFITGYVVVFEVSDPERAAPYVQWITGDGSFPDPDEQLGGLAEHRVDGLLRKAMRDIVLDNTTDE